MSKAPNTMGGELQNVQGRSGEPVSREVHGEPEQPQANTTPDPSAIRESELEPASGIAPDVEARKEDDDERRFYERRTVLWAGKLLFRDKPAECLIINISPEGAMIQIAEELKVGMSVLLRSDRFGNIAAKVIWANVNQYGLVFLDDKEEIAKILCLVIS